MICSKCGAQIMDGSKFCTHCGNKVEPKPVAANVSACPKCGAELKVGAKFCTKCGYSLVAQPVPQPIPQPIPQPTPQPVPQPIPQPAPQPIPQPVPQPAPQPIPQPVPQPVPQPTPEPKPIVEELPPQPMAKPANPVAGQPDVQDNGQTRLLINQQPGAIVEPMPWNPEMAQPQPAAPVKEKKKKKKSNAPLIIILVILLVLVIGGGAFAIMSILGVGPFGEKQEGNSGEAIEATADTAVDETETSGEAVKGDVALLDPAKELIQKASGEFDAGQYGDGSIPDSTEAINTLLTVAEKNNLQDEAADSISQAYVILENSITKYGDVLLQQGANIDCATQTYNCILSAKSLLDEIAAKGYTVDGTELENYFQNTFIQSYRDIYIAAINEITKRENWSRDEAWNYAEQAYSLKVDGKPVLFDETNLEDPLKMRYEYCLAWIIRKRCETGLADGSMTNEAAVQTMVAVLKETDYNILLLQDIVKYGSAAGIDVSAYTSAYNAVVDEIKAEQNLTVGTSIGVNSSTYVDAAHFWYFNDLGGEDKYKVDTYNGTTAATRQWIRNNVPVILGE